MEKVPGIISQSSINVNQTYSYINNTGFYALANPIYYNFYSRFARRYAWWYDRYVPDFHNDTNGIFSTGLAHSLVDGIANQIVGKKVLLQTAGKAQDKTISTETLKKAYKWADGCDLTRVVRTATKYAGALGTSLIKANIGKGDIWAEALRFDNFFFECDFKGELQAVTCLINSYTDTLKEHEKPDKSMENYGNDVNIHLENKYFLVEHRFFKEKKELVKGKYVKHKVPYVVYQVHRYTGNIINTMMWDVSLRENYRWDSVPQNIRNAIRRDYGMVEVGKEQRLPFFEWLGCELVRYNDVDGSLAQQPFGESILTNILSFLMAYDLAFSYFVRDLYQGKGIIFIAKELRTASSGNEALNGLDESMITRVSSLLSDGKIPLDKVQFDLRVAEWREARNFIYENIASHLNISPSSIASYLSDNTARTAKEVSTESSATDNYIEIQRGCLSNPINHFLKGIGMYYGWADEIEIKFSKGGSQNVDTIIDRVIKLKQAGLIHPREALRQIMIDADEYEVEEAYEQLEQYNQEQQQLQQEQQNNLFGSLDFGTEVNNANETK